jgi:hypothetical protein
MMSQRAQSASIMQLTLPDGETKPVSSCTSRSAGAGPSSYSGCVSDPGAVVCAATDGLVSDCVTVAPPPQAASVNTAVSPATAATNAPYHRATITRCMCVQ